MKRIVIDARESGTTSGRYVDKLVEHIHRLETDYEFVIMTKSHRVDFMRSTAPKFEVVAADFKEFTFSEQIGFLRFCRKQKADLIHFPMVQQPIFYPGKKVTTMNDLTTLRFKNPAKNPLLFTLKQHLYAVVNKKVARESDHIITFTDYVRRDIMAYIPDLPLSKFTTTYLAADPITNKAVAIKNLKGKRFIMYVGRPQPHKNLRKLIEAFTLLREEHHNLHLVLAGKLDPLFEQHKEFVREMKIRNVIFAGFVSEGELRWLYENCAAYVFPSLSEGFGLPGVEAMMHGAPVVSSNTTCLPEVNGPAAIYFNPLTTQDMAEKIASVMDDEKLRQKLISHGKKQAARYSWEDTAKKTLAVYEKVLKS